MAVSRLGIFCERLIEAGWLAAVIVAPLFFSDYASTVMDADKIALLRSIASVMIAAWLVKTAADPTRFQKPLRPGMTLATLLLVGAYLLATLTSIAPRDSLFGSYYRDQGVYTLLSFVVIFAMVARELRTRQQLDRLIVTIILTSFPVALYGIAQKIGLDPQVWNISFDGRSGSTIGNPIFLGAYLIMVFALTLGKTVTSLLAAREISPVRKIAPLSSRRNNILTIAYALIAITQAVAIITTDSRGPILGWFAGIVLFTLLIALVGRKRRLVLGAIGLSIVGALFLIVLNLPNTPFAPLRSIPALARLGNLANGTGEFRLFTWENAARLVSPHAPIQFPDGTPDALNAIRPLVGYGPEAILLVYAQVAPTSSFSTETDTDRSHNATWDAWVTTGLIGLIAYQIFFLCIFLYGFRWLDLVPTPRARNVLIGLWLGLGATGAIATIVFRQALYLGIALPAGNIVAMLIYLVGFARSTQTLPQGDSAHRADQVLIAALLAGVFAHYVESQFGIDVSPTQTMLWVFAGLIVVLGSAQLKTDEVSEVTPNGLGQVSSYGILVTIMQSTLVYEFVKSGNGTTDPLMVVWRGLTFDPVHNTASYVVLGLILATWFLSILLILSELARNDLRRGLIMLVAIPSVLTMIFALVLAQQLAMLPNISAAAKPLETVTLLVSQVIGIVDYYTLALFVAMLFAAIALTFQSLPKAWAISQWGAVAAIPIVVAMFVWIDVVNLTPMHAASMYRLGQMLDAPLNENVASALYKRAILLAPANDIYFMTLGKTLQQKSVLASTTTTASLTAQTSAEEILNQDDARITAWNRLDLLYAAQAMLLRARDLNPLYPDHTLNLARFYQPELPLDTPTKTQLMQLADKYYTQAQRLNPNSASLLNERAVFDLDYKNDPDAAIQELNTAIAGDPNHAEAYLNLGKAFAAKKDFAAAEHSYQQALALEPQSADAESHLAFVYYQTGKLDAAIQAYQRYVELTPSASNLWEVHKNLALLYQQIGDFATAEREAQTALRLAPTDLQPLLQELATQLGRH